MKWVDSEFYCILIEKVNMRRFSGVSIFKNYLELELIEKGQFLDLFDFLTNNFDNDDKLHILTRKVSNFKSHFLLSVFQILNF